MKKVDKEKIIPCIQLKYYRTPERSKNVKTSGITCAICFEQNVVNIGGGFSDKQGKKHTICERCAAKRYQNDYGFKTLEAAKASRRRIFDIGYLFNEMVIDRYLTLNGISSYDNLKPGMADDIFIQAADLYNYIFSPEEKKKIEKIENQKIIESELEKVMRIVDFKKFFENINQ